MPCAKPNDLRLVFVKLHAITGHPIANAIRQPAMRSIASLLEAVATLIHTHTHTHTHRTRTATSPAKDQV